MFYYWGGVSLVNEKITGRAIQRLKKIIFSIFGHLKKYLQFIFHFVYNHRCFIENHMMSVSDLNWIHIEKKLCKKELLRNDFLNIIFCKTGIWDLWQYKDDFRCFRSFQMCFVFITHLCAHLGSFFFYNCCDSSSLDCCNHHYSKKRQSWWNISVIFQQTNFYGGYKRFFFSSTHANDLIQIRF